MKKPRHPKTTRKATVHPTPSQKGGSNLASTRVDATRINFREPRGNAFGGNEAVAETAARQRHASDRTSNGAALGWNSSEVGPQGQTGNFLASVGRDAAKHTGVFSEMIGAYTSFGLDPEQDNFDALDIMAQHIIDLLLTNVYTFANLTRFERHILYRYFYKTNPILGRICDAHTDLPLSKVRLQAPPDLPEIAKDYIMQFFNRLLERLNFAEFLRNLVLTHTIYGDAIALVDDFYQKFDRVLQDIVELENTLFDHPPETQQWMDAVNETYETAPKDVKLADRLKYIGLVFGGFFEPDYTGPDRLSVIPFYKINELMENDDIDYLGIKYQLSEPLNKLEDGNVGNEFLKEVGYSEGMLSILGDGTLRDEKSIMIDTDVYDGNPFIFRLRRPEGASLILRVLEQALEWEASTRAMRAKIESIGKVGRVITSEGLSDGQTAVLRSEVQMMLDDPGYAIVGNFPIEWQEVNSQVQAQLDELVEASQRIGELLATGTGMPMSIISGDSQYSDSDTKLEILNVEYYSFKQRIQKMLEDKLFKPIALRKGFVTVDDWGNPIVAYPRLTFSRVSLRDESVFDILFSLYQKGSLPVSIILDILNLDPDDIKRQIKDDLFTVNDPNFNELVRGLSTAALDDIHQQTDLASKLIEELGLERLGDQSQQIIEDGIHQNGLDQFVSPSDGQDDTDPTPAADDGSGAGSGASPAPGQTQPGKLPTDPVQDDAPDGKSPDPSTLDPSKSPTPGDQKTDRGPPLPKMPKPGAPVNFMKPQPTPPLAPEDKQQQKDVFDTKGF